MGLEGLTMKYLLCTLVVCCAACATPTQPAPTPTPETTPTSTPETTPETTTQTPNPSFSPDGEKLGSLDPEVIRKVVREHAGQIRWCYENLLTRAPDVSGKLTISWVIDETGTVVKAQAEHELHPEVDACVMSRILSWKFPKPTGGGFVVVSYPFVFKPSAETSSPAATPSPPPTTN